ncbi:SubName: Full=Uncharacterized protein {ECO:0000313/EMBL:CCA76147.1} [Serendipita indica DSM 11827]|uniref:Uncharacterized protein n=1 Tax=Serendipita indica (strain DSM 11827) TaxID=1109443 RepID=G4TXV4_SERID|nr:SubName: Full=Uncharacterized protein {ECO:0000313/EMBL:CCA76147.1} [Serendipita indica DSM 11827]CCA76147.1 hypothetical protein PIIN_10147 [Serendipita indica DSM 11827]
MRVGFFAILLASTALLGSAAPLPKPYDPHSVHREGRVTHQALADHHRDAAVSHRAQATNHRIQATMNAHNQNVADRHRAEANRHTNEADHHSGLAAQHQLTANFHASQIPRGQRRSIDELE